MHKFIHECHDGAFRDVFAEGRHRHCHRGHEGFGDFLGDRRRGGRSFPFREMLWSFFANGTRAPTRRHSRGDPSASR